jgi:hypothetical protein
MKSGQNNTLPTGRKIRKNVILSQSVIDMGKALAVADRRSFSKMLEVLIVRAHAKIERSYARRVVAGNPHSCSGCTTPRRRATISE